MDDIIFTNEDWQEVCERFHKLTFNEATEFCKEIHKAYPLNEFGYNCSRFSTVCANVALQVHFTIINICCLGSTICVEDVHHWKKELVGHLNKVITANLNKQVKRAETVFDEIIEPYLDVNYYTYEDTYMYDMAMKDEIKKGLSSSATIRQRSDALYIKQYILPNLQKYVDANNERVSKLFKALISSCQKEDINMFIDAVDEFAETDVQIN